MQHRKHALLTRKKQGNLGPLELAVLGTKCGLISNLIDAFANVLSDRHKLGYADASHADEDQKQKVDRFTFHHSGQLMIDQSHEMNPYSDPLLFQSYDLLFINGNHFPGKNQVLILDPEKEASALKRIDQLDKVLFFIKKTENAEIFPFILDKYPHYQTVPVFEQSDVNGMAALLSQWVDRGIPEVKGLVLAGGKSTRMGTDKGLLEYYGKSQRLYSMELLENVNLKTFLSVRREQQVDDPQVIEDVFLGLGPFGAICSAFQNDPNSAWLTLATDLPYVDEKLIRYLLDERDPSKFATALKGKNKRFPEPLVTIWEPKAYPLMLRFLAQGISCPRKVLINSDIKELEVDDDFITNVNTPEEFSAVKDILNK